MMNEEHPWKAFLKADVKEWSKLRKLKIDEEIDFKFADKKIIRIKRIK